METENYTISDMVDGKVTHICINKKKVQLTEPLSQNEIEMICNNFFNAIDFGTSIKQPIKSHKDIMQTAIENSPPHSIHVLGSVIYKYHTFKLHGNLVKEMRERLKTDEFDRHDLKPILLKFFPNANIDTKSKTYFTMLNHSKMCVKINKSHSKFNMVKADINIEEMKNLQDKEREIKENMYK